MRITLPGALLGVVGGSGVLKGSKMPVVTSKDDGLSVVTRLELDDFDLGLSLWKYFKKTVNFYETTKHKSLVGYKGLANRGRSSTDV